jgi:hypothetical protein
MVQQYQIITSGEIMINLLLLTALLAAHAEIVATNQAAHIEKEFEIKRKAVVSREQQCPICLEKPLPNDLVSFRSSAQNCEHSVCKTCYPEFVKHHTKCPYCRQSFERLVDAQGSTLYTRPAPTQLGRCALGFVKAGIILIPISAMVGLQLMCPAPYGGLSASFLGAYAWQLIMGEDEPQDYFTLAPE